MSWVESQDPGRQVFTPDTILRWHLQRVANPGRREIGTSGTTTGEHERGPGDIFRITEIGVLGQVDPFRRKSDAVSRQSILRAITGRPKSSETGEQLDRAAGRGRQRGT